ncbi:phosphoglucosamine mutase [Halobellus salinisoli]|uniref:phosphoglucosamine mutase n=1 Tax=Halobellus salinisoli TaxID=3108500 RepID=UPI00300ABBEC
MFASARIRGTYGSHVTAKLALKTGRALTSNRDEVVLGHSPSESARLLADAVSTGVRECGGTVVRLGETAGPTVANGVRRLGGDVGVAVVAVDGRPERTSLKLFDGDGSPLSWKQQSEIVRRVNRSTADIASWEELGSERRWEDATAHHVDRLCKNRPTFSDTRVVVAVGEHETPVTVEALGRLGCEVNRLAGTGDDALPQGRISPDDDVCATLRRAVATSDADFGVAHDVDAERLVVVDERGELIEGNSLVALLARRAVRDAGRNACVAIPQGASRRIDDVVADAGGQISKPEAEQSSWPRPEGSANVVFGGDPNGVHQWPEESPCPDAALSAINLARLVDDGAALSEQLTDVPAYPFYCKSFGVDSLASEMIRVAADAKERFESVSTDGCVLGETGDAWFVVRPDRTEPALQVTAEGTSRRSAKQLFERVTSLVGDEQPAVTT